MNSKNSKLFSESMNLNFILKLLFFSLIPLYQKFLLFFYPIFLIKILKFKLVKKPFTRLQICNLLFITYILLHDFYFERFTLSTLRNVAPFVLFFIFSLLNYDSVALKKIKDLLYVIFFINLFFNIAQILTNSNFKGDEINYFSNFYHSLGGIYGHPYLSLTLSLATFIFAYHFRNKKILIASILSMIITSSYRSVLSIFPLLVGYYFLGKKFKLYQIIFILFLGIFLVFTFVNLDSNYEEYKRCSLNIHTQEYYLCAGYNSSALRIFATAKGCNSVSVSTKMARSAPIAKAVRSVS